MFFSRNVKGPIDGVYPVFNILRHAQKMSKYHIVDCISRLYPHMCWLNEHAGLLESINSA